MINSVAQIAYRYIPKIGGLEIYVDQLAQVLADVSRKQAVFQIRLSDSKAEAGVHLLHRTPHLPNQVSFNLALKRARNHLSNWDHLIVHNQEHYFPVRKHRSVTVVNHCPTWTTETNVIRRWLRLLATKHAWKNAQVMVVNNAYVLKAMGVESPQPFSEVSKGRWYIPNGVDLSIFTPGQGTDDRSQKTRILVPRNLTYQKGADLAISAFAIFTERVPHSELIILGDSFSDLKKQDWYKDHCKQLVASFGLEKKIVFLGRKPFGTISDYYRSAALTVIPTRSGEGTSLAALESMASGCPVVSTSVEGLLDLPCAKAVPTAEALAERMLTVYHEREEYSERQLQAVRRDFGSKKWALAWKQALNSLA